MSVRILGLLRRVGGCFYAAMGQGTCQKGDLVTYIVVLSHLTLQN